MWIFSCFTTRNIHSPLNMKNQCFLWINSSFGALFPSSSWELASHVNAFFQLSVSPTQTHSVFLFIFEFHVFKCLCWLPLSHFMHWILHLSHFIDCLKRNLFFLKIHLPGNETIARYWLWSLSLSLLHIVYPIRLLEMEFRWNTIVTISSVLLYHFNKFLLEFIYSIEQETWFLSLYSFRGDGDLNS